VWTSSPLRKPAVSRTSGLISKEKQLSGLKKIIHETPGPSFLQIKVIAEKLPLVLPPQDGGLLKARFRLALLGLA